jgi:hypothetical protein
MRDTATRVSGSKGAKAPPTWSRPTREEGTGWFHRISDIPIQDMIHDYESSAAPTGDRVGQA